jgi:hypothetical protein
MKKLIVFFLSFIILTSCTFTSKDKHKDSDTTSAEGPKAPEQTGISVPMKKDSSKKGTLKFQPTDKAAKVESKVKHAPDLDTISVH